MIRLTLIQGDCLKVLPKLPDRSIDLVITDPPYNFEAFGGGFYDFEKGGRRYLLKAKEDGITEFNPIPFLNLVEPKMKKVNLVVFCNKFLVHDYLDWAIKRNYHFDIHTLIKENPIPAKKNHFLHDTEYIIVIRGPGAYFNNECKIFDYYRKWFMIKITKNKYHVAEKPVSLIEKYVAILSREGDTVLDCFLGSGTTMLACMKLKRNCIGIEINPEYVEIAKKRLNWGSSLGNVEFRFYKEDEFKGVVG